MIQLRSLLFYLGTLPITIVFSLISVLILPLDRRVRYFIITRWSWLTLLWLRICCGLKVTVRGQENIPAEAGIIFCKHQSAWETMSLQFIFPPHAQVLKRELFWVPFFGWGLACLNPIAIDRSAGTKALKHVLREGQKRLEDNWWILLFPEGTRTPPGTRRKYSQSAAALALRTGRPLVPVAHNAGVFWSRNAFTKYPGTIEVVIGEPITVDGHSAAELTAEAENWIEETCEQLPLKP